MSYREILSSPGRIQVPNEEIAISLSFLLSLSLSLFSSLPSFLRLISAIFRFMISHCDCFTLSLALTKETLCYVRGYQRKFATM